MVATHSSATSLTLAGSKANYPSDSHTLPGSVALRAAASSMAISASSSCGHRIGEEYTSKAHDCSESYYTHVRGDRTAALGTGKRFLLWLDAHQPATYQKLANVRDPCELEARGAA